MKTAKIPKEWLGPWTLDSVIRSFTWKITCGSTMVNSGLSLIWIKIPCFSQKLNWCLLNLTVLFICFKEQLNKIQIQMPNWAWWHAWSISTQEPKARGIKNNTVNLVCVWGVGGKPQILPIKLNTETIKLPSLNFKVMFQGSCQINVRIFCLNLLGKKTSILF